MHAESLSQIDAEQWRLACADNSKPYPRTPEPIVLQASRIRSVFYRATNLEALKYTHRLLGWFAGHYANHPQGRMWYLNLSADYDRAKKALENPPSNPYLWGRDLRSRFENL